MIQQIKCECRNRVSSCSCDWNDNIKVSHRPLFLQQCLIPLFLSSQYLTHSVSKKRNPTLHSTPNFQLLRLGRLLRCCPLLGTINLRWEQQLITREQGKIRPLCYWWFIIHFHGVNGEPYLRCQRLIYTFCSCTKSSAVFWVQGGLLMEGVEGQVRLGCLPRTRLCF